MGRPISINSKDTIVSIWGHKVTRLQRFSYSPNLNSEQIWEAGNDNFVENSFDDVITSTVSFENNEWGAIDNLQMALGIYNGGQNTGTITEDDFKDPLTHFMVYEMDKAGNGLQSFWIPAATLSGVTLNYDARGIARESFEFVANMDYAFVGKYKYSKVYKGTYDTQTSFTVDDPNIQQTDILFVAVDSQIYDSSVVSSVTNDTVAGTTTINLTGITIESTNRLALVTYVATGFPSKLTTSGVGGIRGGAIKLYLGSDKWLRVQTASINARIEREELRELGTGDPLAQDYNNMTFEVNVTALKSDLYEYAVLTGHGADWANRDTNGLIMTVRDAIGQKSTLKVEIYDKPGGVLLKDVVLTDMEFNNKDNNLDVPGRQEISFTLIGSKITFNGYGAVGRLASGTNWNSPIN